MKQLSAIFLSLLILAACQKKELPAPAFDRGDVITNQVEMGSSYKHQIWFSLSDDRVISTNLKTAWDLAFETSATGNHILLNGSKAMKVYKTNSTDLAAVTDTAGLEANARADVPSGKLDSTAIGNWADGNTVYIINRGYDEGGQLQGFYKLKITSATAGQFTFDYGDIFGTEIRQGVVSKNDAYNFTMYSFTTHQQLAVEPEKTAYDLCFTAYTHFFTNPFQFYQVTGVLQNSYRTRVMSIRDKAFADISLNDTLGRVFSTDRNKIGYEWKTFSLATNLYTINPTYCYIIHDRKGFYYKLHFIDFYTTSGIKGSPKFEFKKL